MTHFYPEMSQTKPEGAKVVAKLVRMGFYLKWEVCHHQEVLEMFAASKVKVKNLEIFETVKGGKKYSAMMTIKAFDKIRNLPIVTQECLLD